MENIQQIVNYLIDKKAKENNTIDLNAYARGALDAFEKSKAHEMLEKLAEVKDLLEAYPSEAEMHLKAVEIRQLIKEATEL